VWRGWETEIVFVVGVIVDDGRVKVVLIVLVVFGGAGIDRVIVGYNHRRWYFVVFAVEGSINVKCEL
jgi:hypothetical protein